MKGPTRTCLNLKRAMHFNLGSAENGFLWFVKKNKLRDGCKHNIFNRLGPAITTAFILILFTGLALTTAQFETGIAALADLTPPSVGLRNGIDQGEVRACILLCTYCWSCDCVLCAVSPILAMQLNGLFQRCGGRKGRLHISEFLEYHQHLDIAHCSQRRSYLPGPG